MDQLKKFERAKAALVVELPELQQVATAVLTVAKRLAALDDASICAVISNNREPFETVASPGRKIIDGLCSATLQSRRKFRRKAGVGLSDFRAAVEFIEAALAQAEG